MLGLDEPVKEGEPPTLSYLLSGDGRTAIDIDTLTFMDTADGHAQTWQAVFVLPADAGLNNAETLKFIYSAVDDLDNVSNKVSVDNAFQIYQGDLPPLEAPTGLTGVSMPAGKISLTWNAVDSAAGYLVYRMPPGQIQLSRLTTLDTTQYTDQPDQEGTYTYAVASLRSVNGQEAESGQSASVEVESDATAPGVPTGLTLALTPQGILAQWTEPALAETVTYTLYRADAAKISSVEDLGAVHTDIQGAQSLDTTPSETHHYYVVTAVDPAGNESAPSEPGYLDFELLPVQTLTVTRSGQNAPVIAWTHTGSSITGYDIYLGPLDNLVKLNSERLTQSSFTDTGYDGRQRQYTVVAVNHNDVPSLGRSIVLPVLGMDLPGDAVLKRGLMNRLEYTVTNSGTSAVEKAVLKVTAQGREHASQTFGIDPGESQTVPVVIGGYSDLPDMVSLVSAIEITPNDGETVRIENQADIKVGTGMFLLTFTNDELVRGTKGEIVFTLENTGDEQIEIITARSNGRPSADITLYLSDEDGNILSTGTYTQVYGSNVVNLYNGGTIARINPGETLGLSMKHLTRKNIPCPRAFMWIRAIRFPNLAPERPKPSLSPCGPIIQPMKTPL